MEPEYDWSSVWLTQEVAKTQAELMRAEFGLWVMGDEHHAFTAFHKLMGRTSANSLLDIGCGAGVYAKLWRRLGRGIYKGCDQSEEMVREARATPVSDMPEVSSFIVADANELPWRDRSFSTVLMGGLLCCTEHWEQIVAEAARISSRYLLFHRMPLYQEGPDTKIVIHDVYGTDAPYREFRESFAEEYVSRFGKLIGTERWPRQGGNMASYLVEKQ